MRVEAVCLCADLSPVDNRTEVHILQHRKERRHAFNTVRILRIGLQNLQVHELHNDLSNPDQGFARPRGFPTNADGRAGVLYPGPDSIDLSELAPELCPGTLVVIDGTWSQAHCMYRDLPWLRSLTRYSLSPKSPSRYRIRKEPRAECLSTLESAVMALELIEPETKGITGLSHAFDLMNDRQVARMEEHRGEPRRFKQVRPRPMRAIPEVLWAHPERVVAVYGESASRPHEQSEQDPRSPSFAREMAQWSAVRLTEPERYLDGIVETQIALPGGQFLSDLEWTAEDLAHAEPLASIRERWQQFLQPNDVVVAWNKGTGQLALCHGFLEESNAPLVLRALYGNTTQRNFGTLDNVIAHDKLGPGCPVPVAGRAGIRLANARLAALELGRWARNRMATP